MNTIKFRGKSLSTGEWVYGHYYGSLLNGDHIIIEEMFSEHISVDPKTVGQYIGIKDKKENEVYEDDIVQEKNRCGGELIARIIYYKNGFYLDDGIYSNWDAEDITVLGNFTDNHDLLT